MLLCLIPAQNDRVPHSERAGAEDLSILAYLHPQTTADPWRELALAWSFFVTFRHSISKEDVSGNIAIHEAVLYNISGLSKRDKGNVVRHDLLVGHANAAVARLHMVLLLQSPLVYMRVRVLIWRFYLRRGVNIPSHPFAPLLRTWMKASNRSHHAT